MRNIAYFIKESYMSFEEVMNLPYAVFLSLLRQFRIMQLEQTTKGREQLSINNTLYKTEPDLKNIRNRQNYKSLKK